MPHPRPDIQELCASDYDLIVIGGGINGVGVAREAAGRGLKVLLVDQNDFAFGASSRSTKLLHGGLRYLEQGDFALVAEALKERRVLCEVLAPHLTRALPFLVPVYAGDARPGWLIRCGLWLYDALALKGRGFIHAHRWLGARAAGLASPDLAREGLRGAAEYWDCQMDDARLALETLLDAQGMGCRALNYCSLRGAPQLRDGAVRVLLRDEESGRECEARGRLLVLAAGAWTDKAFHQLGFPKTAPRVHPTKGVHLVTRRLIEGHALLVPARSDGRIFFVIPWDLEGRPASLIGTTDSDYSGDENHPAAEAGEIDYLLAETARVLPRARLGRADVWATFAGLRPLSAPRHSGHANAAVSREHTFWEEPGLLAVTGGKYTTYRSLCQSLVDRAAKRLGLEPPASLSASRPLPGAPGPGEPRGRDLELALSRDCGLGPATAGLLARTYGRLAWEVCALCERDPGLRQALAPDSDCGAILAMAAWAALHEQAVHLDDLYLRRTRLGLLLAPDHRGVDRVAAVMGSVLGWDKRRQERELERLKQVLTQEYR
ncbi:MAG TPA: glycerol-3-phosphate dehydrogenase/oxidase [bacterium]|jgi:glycerol-3-phosphate dehydrogenase|nr:glycerol-3-phosphate dehydrogenase/oxidase [bacterium]